MKVKAMKTTMVGKQFMTDDGRLVKCHEKHQVYQYRCEVYELSDDDVNPDWVFAYNQIFTAEELKKFTECQ